MKRILDGGEVAWEGGQRIPVQLVPIELIPGYDPDPEDQSRENEKAEVLDTVLWSLSYIARFKRPTIALDVLAVATGLIFNLDQSVPAIAAKHHIRPEVFERLLSRAKRQLAQLREPTRE